MRARLPGPDERLRVAPARLRRKQAAHSIASSTRAASQAGAGGGKGEGRGGTGEKVREREGDPETSRPGHDVTSRWFGRGGAGAAFVSAPEDQVGAGLRAGGGGGAGARASGGYFDSAVSQPRQPERASRPRAERVEFRKP